AALDAAGGAADGEAGRGLAGVDHIVAGNRVDRDGRRGRVDGQAVGGLERRVAGGVGDVGVDGVAAVGERQGLGGGDADRPGAAAGGGGVAVDQIGRASCRGRGEGPVAADAAGGASDGGGGRGLGG